MPSALKKSLHAAEQDRPDVAQAREQWKAVQTSLDPKKLVFVDETGTNTKMVRGYGRCRRGQRLIGKQPWGHWKTTTFTAGLRCDGISAPWVLDGPMNRDAFLTYVEAVLAPTLAAGDIVVIDNLLTTEALESLRLYCRGSDIWHTAYSQGYLGAFPESGFAAPLLAQVAEEFSTTFPEIFADHPLRYHWAFKYDSSLDGIGIHADEAAVNVNFWITPDEANLDAQGGGLVIWDKEAPLEWDFAKFNADESAAYDFLAQSGARPIRIPYRTNRAVIFDSNLFHKTDNISFAPGYENRRINITMLYGRRRRS